MNSLPISALVLSGGRGQRVNHQDKGLLEWQGQPLIKHVLDTLQPQVDQIVLSCNRNLSNYQQFNLPIVSDLMPDYQGPLAGIISALQSGQIKHERLVVCSCDTPSLPSNWVNALLEKQQSESLECVYAFDGKREQYLTALLSTQCQASLEKYLDTGGRSVKGWYQRLNSGYVDFSSSPDCFQNFNSLEQLSNNQH